MGEIYHNKVKYPSAFIDSILKNKEPFAIGFRDENGVEYMIEVKNYEVKKILHIKGDTEDASSSSS